MTPQELRELRKRKRSEIGITSDIKIVHLASGTKLTAPCHGLGWWNAKKILTKEASLIQVQYLDRASMLMDQKQHVEVMAYISELKELFKHWVTDIHWSADGTEVWVTYDLWYLPGCIFLSIANCFRAINENILTPYMWTFMGENHPELNPAQRLMMTGTFLPVVETASHYFTGPSSGRNLREMHGFYHFNEIIYTTPSTIECPRFSIAGMTANQLMYPVECRSGIDGLGRKEYSPENVQKLLNGWLHTKGEW